MWQKLSLRSRINLLLALGLTLGLAINIARLVVEAAPRVRAEDQSVIRLAREFVETIVPSLNEAPDPEARLNQIASDLSRLRHVSITRQGDAATGEHSGNGDGERSPPAWFIALVHPETTTVSVPITIHGKPQSLLITSHPNDEVAEIWDGIVTQLAVGTALALALFLVTMTVVGRALAPLQALSQTMANIEAGQYDSRVEPGGPPELAVICAKLNHLAGALGEAVEDKRLLAERTVSLQDMERKEIARELHDEFGPHLFTLRAHAGALARLSEDGRAPSADALRKHATAIMEQLNALQKFNRRILEKLRPVGLAELGLAEALGVLLRLWRESRPDVAIEASIACAPGEGGEVADLTIYRTVQEALTNAFRHADATTVSVTVEQTEGIPGSRGCALVRVSDNGRGLAPDHKSGFGLIGMRERILALGGTLNVVSGDGGVTVEAVVPHGSPHG
ncbi:histidine kinase [Bradyrhizobium jicamae]|uniref:Histidine kinase n=1 Tax=Bradyrhizobium jicamae TaxID=280332 RepID=A0A0R3LKP4_9BRAD|nr:histidine kinase [Bradyrhizobium jicamae]KRR05987.1 histidine kinase [Bradyrhizobium jicamae]